MYEHRSMRCKLDRSALIMGRRYRPGEILEEGHTPTDAFEPYDPPAPKAVPEKPKPVRAERVRVTLPPLPKLEDDIHGD